jgi:hypothetical protein
MYYVFTYMFIYVRISECVVINAYLFTLLYLVLITYLWRYF